MRLTIPYEIQQTKNKAKDVGIIISVTSLYPQIRRSVTIHCMASSEYVEKRSKDSDNTDLGSFKFSCERPLFLKKKINFIVKFSILFFQYI